MCESVYSLYTEIRISRDTFQKTAYKKASNFRVVLLSRVDLGQFTHIAVERSLLVFTNVCYRRYIYDMMKLILENSKINFKLL